MGNTLNILLQNRTIIFEIISLFDSLSLLHSKKFKFIVYDTISTSSIFLILFSSLQFGDKILFEYYVLISITITRKH